MARRAAVAGWLTILCALGAAYVSVIVGVSPVLAQVAGGLAACASVALGCRLGYRRDWRRLARAAVIGSVVLTAWAEVAWVGRFFVLAPVGSGGLLGALAPLLIAVLGCPVFLGGLGAVLGAGALAGLAWRDRSMRRGAAAAGAVVAVGAVAALVIAALGGAAVTVEIRPTARQVTGSWTGPRGARLTLAQDGTFTATGLPAGFGEAWNGQPPVAGSGTWRIGSFASDADIGVIFDFPSLSQAELLVERTGPSLFLYYDKGDPDEGWSGQYRFARQ
jgi:hypothetical protein